MVDDPQKTQTLIKQLKHLVLMLDEHDDLLSTMDGNYVDPPYFRPIKQLGEDISDLVPDMIEEFEFHGSPLVVRSQIRGAKGRIIAQIIALEDLLPQQMGPLAGIAADLQGPLDKRDVVVVYGRNEQVNRALFQLLRAMGLNPIEWSEAVARTGQGSPYPGEVLDTVFSQGQAIVVLLTGDDLAQLRPELLKSSDDQYERVPTPQPRPNVLFEAGMAFGRHAARTIVVAVGKTRPFSDTLGRHIVHLSQDAESRHELASRLRTAGCLVQTDHRKNWLTEGDFEAVRTFHNLPDPYKTVERKNNPEVGGGATVRGALTVEHTLPLFDPSLKTIQFDWDDHISLKIDWFESNSTIGFVCTFVNGRPEYLDSYTVEVAEAQSWSSTHKQLLPNHEFVRRTIDKGNKFAPMTQANRHLLVRTVMRQDQTPCLAVGNDDQGKLIWPNADHSNVESWRLTLVVIYKPLQGKQVPPSHAHLYIRWDREKGSIEMLRSGQT